MANFLEDPLAAAAIATGKMRCAVEIDGRLRLIPLARKPTTTPASRSNESSSFSLVDIPTGGQTTPGSVQMVMGLQEGTDWDEYFRERAASNGDVKIDLRIKGQRIVKSGDADKVQVKAVADSTGHAAGLSEVTFTKGAGGIDYVAGDNIKRGRVIELAVTNVDPYPAGGDLIVISHILYADGDGATPQFYAKPVKNAIAAAGPFSIYDQSINWTYEGKALSYNDQFDEVLGLCALEMSQAGFVANRSLIRNAAADAAQEDYTA